VFLLFVLIIAMPEHITCKVCMTFTPAMLSSVGGCWKGCVAPVRAPINEAILAFLPGLAAYKGDLVYDHSYVANFLAVRGLYSSVGFRGSSLPGTAFDYEYINYIRDIETFISARASNAELEGYSTILREAHCDYRCDERINVNQLNFVLLSVVSEFPSGSPSMK